MCASWRDSHTRIEASGGGLSNQISIRVEGSLDSFTRSFLEIRQPSNQPKTHEVTEWGITLNVPSHFT